MDRMLKSPANNWLTDAMVEPLAIAICYGGFSILPSRDPIAYWEFVHPERKAEYRQAARRMIGFVLDGSRLTPRRPDDGTLDRYMTTMRLTNFGHASRHYAALFDALPTIWAEYVENGG